MLKTISIHVKGSLKTKEEFSIQCIYMTNPSLGDNDEWIV